MTTERFDYNTFCEELFSIPMKNSSMLEDGWADMSTLRCRELVMQPAKKTEEEKQIEKPKKQSKFLTKIVKLFACGVEKAEVVLPPPELKKPAAKEQADPCFRLVELSYQAEMVKLQEEIENLKEQKHSLMIKNRQKRLSRKIRKAQIEKEANSSSGVSSMDSSSDLDVLFIC